MFTLTTKDGYTVGFLATSKRQIKTWIRCSCARVKAGWLDCSITKHTTWPNNVMTVFDVKKEMQEIEAFLAQHSGIWYNGERVD